jgi:hypothetical protein
MKYVKLKMQRCTVDGTGAGKREKAKDVSSFCLLIVQMYAKFTLPELFPDLRSELQCQMG